MEYSTSAQLSPMGVPQRETRVTSEVNRQTALLSELHGVISNLETRLSHVLNPKMQNEGNLAKDVEQKVGLAQSISNNNGGIMAAINKMVDITQGLEI